MQISQFEREEINNAARFLQDMGYSEAEDQYSIRYSLNDVTVSIIYPPSSDESEVNIFFSAENQSYSIGWIALIKDNVQVSKDRLSNVKVLLEYIDDNYLQVTDCRLCKKYQSLADQYVETHHDLFESSLKAFLAENQ